MAGKNESEMKVLILGSWGFLGSNLILALEQHFKGACGIIAFDRKAEHPLHLNSKSIEKVYYGDFRDSNLMQRILSENKIDIVFHLISTTVPATSADVRYDIETNLLPTIELLEQMAQHGLSRIVFISSGGAVYGDSPKRHKEDDEVFPINSYGVVKITIEKYLFMYAHRYNILPLIVRLSNPYGAFHLNEKQGFINVALRRAINCEPVEIWGDGNNRKDYIYVEDAIGAIVDLVRVGAWNNIVNVGCGNEYSLNDILGVIKELVPGFSWQYLNSQAFDTKNFALDVGFLTELKEDSFD